LQEKILTRRAQNCVFPGKKRRFRHVPSHRMPRRRVAKLAQSCATEVATRSIASDAMAHSRDRAFATTIAKRHHVRPFACACSRLARFLLFS